MKFLVNGILSRSRAFKRRKHFKDRPMSQSLMSLRMQHLPDQEDG